MQVNKLNLPVSAEQIRQGDVGEYERLFRSCYKRLCIYAEHIIGNRMDAEEIVCDLFVRIWERREQLPVRVSLESYMVSSVHHEAVNYLKHAEVEERYREKVQYQLKHLDLLNPEGVDTPLTDMIEKEMYELLEKAIQTLPQQCREVFVLHMMDELSYEEIAVKLNVTINTVRTQITRAMKKMRNALAPFYRTGDG
ncbi:MAG: RNA polymerase sigma-70 factor [Tannerella sp.]|jgi:RNA polymerase sigma-70 factor (ECF subfamily)|nr:RNA polymerase sigma-70 factor [Tannerella sp.]